MDGQMDEWTDERREGWTDVRMKEYLYISTD